MARGAARSKQKERESGRRNTKQKERKKAGQERGVNPEEEKKDAVRAARFTGSGSGVGRSA